MLKNPTRSFGIRHRRIGIALVALGVLGALPWSVTAQQPVKVKSHLRAARSKHRHHKSVTVAKSKAVVQPVATKASAKPVLNPVTTSVAPMPRATPLVGLTTRTAIAAGSPQIRQERTLPTPATFIASVQVTPPVAEPTLQTTPALATRGIGTQRIAAASTTAATGQAQTRSVAVLAPMQATPAMAQTAEVQALPTGYATPALEHENIEIRGIGFANGAPQVSVHLWQANLLKSLTELFEAAHVDYVIPSGVKFDSITCSLRQVSLEEALKAILSESRQHLGFSRNENGVYHIVVPAGGNGVGGGSD